MVMKFWKGYNFLIKECLLEELIYSYTQLTDLNILSMYICVFIYVAIFVAQVSFFVIFLKTFCDYFIISL